MGESGSGKSVTSQAVLGLLTRTNALLSGEVWLDGEELITASPELVRHLRGLKMAMIFQDPLSAMHPYYTVGNQIVEAYRIHNDVSKKEARVRAIDLLRRVGIPEPTRRVDDYPHQFSGGMRQRAMIAMALACNPSLLIADEPTTALDVTVQAQILDLIRDLQSEFDSAVIIITHDLGVVAELADDILVMYGGKAVEYGSSDAMFRSPEHPYTWGLLSSVPRMDRARQERLVPIKGSPPSLINVPSGCAFHPRCPFEPRTEGLGRTSGPGARAHLERAPRALPPRAAGTTSHLHRGGGSQAVSVTPETTTPSRAERGSEELLSVRGLKKYFPILRGLMRRQVGAVQAVDGIDFACGGARLSASSARAGAARRRWDGWSPGSRADRGDASPSRARTSPTSRDMRSARSAAISRSSSRTRTRP